MRVIPVMSRPVLNVPSSAPVVETDGRMHNKRHLL
jgi:hypothetical protein